MLTEDVKSDIIRNEKGFSIAYEKIEKFCLLPGAKHSEEFFSVGYRPSDVHKLINDILSDTDSDKITDIMKFPNNVEKFSLFMYLGVTKKKRFRTVWQKDTPESYPRLITAYRED